MRSRHSRWTIDRDYGVYNPSLGTEVVVVGAEVEREESLADAITLEQAIRGRVLSGLGISVRTILLKPPAGRFDAQKNPRPARCN